MRKMILENLAKKTGNYSYERAPVYENPETGSTLTPTRAFNDPLTYHSACYKITHRHTGKVAYILGSMHSMVSPRVKSSIDSFVYDIRPRNVYFEVDMASSKLWKWNNAYTSEYFHGTEYYVYRAASQLGSTFSGLESSWYQLLMLVQNTFFMNKRPFNFIFAPVNRFLLQPITKESPFLSMVFFSTGSYLLSRIASSFARLQSSKFSTSISNGLRVTNYILAALIGYVKLDSLFSISKMSHAYKNAFKVPVLNKFPYFVTAELMASCDIRNQDWVHRVILPRLEGKNEETENGYFLYWLLNAVTDKATFLIENIIIFPVKIVGMTLYDIFASLLRLIGIDATLSSPFLQREYWGAERPRPGPGQSESKQDDRPQGSPYKIYLHLKNRQPQITADLTYEDYLQYYQQGAKADCHQAIKDSFQSVKDEYLEESQCNDLYVIGANHLIAPGRFLGFDFKGTIDRLREKENIRVEEIDMNNYLPLPPCPLRPAMISI